jgi:hypothetical protein
MIMKTLVGPLLASWCRALRDPACGALAGSEACGRYVMRRLALVIAVAMVLVVPTGADAGLILFLDDQDGNSVMIEDGKLGDINPLAGAVTYLGTLGEWTVNVTTAISKPLLGPQPTIDLNSVNVGGGTGTLLVRMTDTDFTVPAGQAGFTSEIGGTTDGKVEYWTWIDNANAEFGMTTPLAAVGPFGPGAFAGTFGQSALVPGLFSMTQEVQITHGSRFDITSFNAKLSVPEPGTLMLMGLGLLSIGFSSRRARRR